MLSHTDKAFDFDYHLALLSTGAYLEYDQALRHPIDDGNDTARLVAEMVGAGHAARLMLGTDGARRAMWTAYGGSPGLAALVTEFVPVLADLGVGDDAIRQMLVTNPARFLAFSGSAP